ncbi:MAG: phenylalanine--tRNA ligase subunit beta [Ginsengibacter sp.]
MKISYNWLVEYLPIDEATLKITGDPQRISEILTSVGLEVESLEKYEQVKNGLEGLVTAKVITCEKHPDADKLKITTVDNGHGETLQIVCGAPNVMAGQMVILAPVGATLYPLKGDPFTIKKAKIRGVESNGMLCAEDEIGLGQSHEGIMVLPEDTIPGTLLKDHFKLYSDWIFEIGLTPNRMDAMSHLGVAKDVCAYITHHLNKSTKVIYPFKNNFKPDDQSKPMQVEIKNPQECERYSGISISGIKVAESPEWLKNKLKSIGLRPVNNIVDITNFILHETGQPLHAFDLDKIKGNKVIVETLPEGTSFVTLDEKERKLSSEDIMICDGENTPMCIAGVFGGLDSGVSDNTVDLFLESAVFNAASIRKSMLAHNLRTEAAVRFEKGINIGNTVEVLKRAALMMRDLAGGKISSDVIDIYPVPRQKKEVTLSNFYLKKISGKKYHPDTVKDILTSLNYIIVREGIDNIQVEVPYSNPDISLPADIIEEIMRIDGLDNIEIPSAITITPSIDKGLISAAQKEKISGWLMGNGFHEIFTNSITNSKYFTKEILASTVAIINSLSEDLNVMRPSMLPTGLECISYNLNRKNTDLLFFEFGKTYSHINNSYHEKQNLAIYITGHQNETNWNSSLKETNIYFAKGICEAIFSLTGIENYKFEIGENEDLDECLTAVAKGKSMLQMGAVNKSQLAKFSIKQPVYFVSFDWDNLMSLNRKKDIAFEPVSKFPQVQRDLAILVNKSLSYGDVEELVKSLHIKKLQGIRLFDVFENEKLGDDKKSFAINFTFLDKEKTMTDEEVETIMNKIISNLESKLNVVIRNNG